MSVDVLIPSVFSTGFEKNLKNELVLDKLSATKYADNLKKGDELDVELPGMVTMTDWDGSDLSDPEKVAASTVKVKVNKGKAINFELDEAKAAQIDGAENDKAMALADEYSQDGVHQFAEAVDLEIGKLYPVAGIYKEGSDGAAIVLTKDNVANMLSVMKAEFQRAKAWKTGKMGAFLPPEISALMNQVAGLLNTETGMKQREAGYVGKLAGWQIFESNNIASDSEGNVYPLFGVLGETTASVKQRKLKLHAYMREKSLNQAFKGAGVFGTGCPRPDKLGTIKAKVTLSI